MTSGLRAAQPFWRRGFVHHLGSALYALDDELRLRTRRLRQRRPRRVLIAYWGSIEDGRPTIGDELAVAALARWLQRRQIEAVVASFEGLPADIPWVLPANVEPERYGCMVFACGPLTGERSLLRFAHRFGNVPRLAVGVSVLAGQRRVLRFYDSIVARDGGVQPCDDRTHARFDLALAGEVPLEPSIWNSDGPALMCLRGRQEEYGGARCHSEEAEQILEAVAAGLGRSRGVVDTVLSSNPGGAHQIETAFGNAGVVLTTRLHGSLLALRAGVPFVAVDQIAGGAKVSEALTKLGYPFAFRVDTLDLEKLQRAAQEATSPAFRPRLLEMRARAVELSRAALEEAGGAVERLL